MGDARGNRGQTDSSSGWKIARVVLSSFVIASLAVVVDRFLVTPVFLRPIYVQRAVDSAVEYKDGALDEHVVSMFVTYDENLDGAIDLSEFVKVANRILNRKRTESATEEIVDGVPDWDSSGEQITLLSFFTPLVLTSMTKYSEAHFTGSELPLQGLKSWKNVATPMATFPVNAFGAFVPLQFWTVSLGEPWYIVEPRINKLGPNLSNDRYYPPPVKGRLAILFRLLAMFHPRPFLLTRFGPQGTVACVRAENQDYWDIVFRIHAEFQLNEPPLLPFWFTPGQFLGNIVVKKDGQHIKSFHMAVPTNRSLNVDMEWLVTDEQQRIDSGGNDEEGPPDMEVDIGYLPEMKLGSTAPSDVLIETEEKKDSSKVKEIKWDKEISFEEAYGALEVKLYTFKEVPYLPFRDAIDKARVENKLVHHILLWGALDDQSC